MIFPEPVIRQAIEPKTKADQEKLSVALQRLAEEDPTFTVRSDEETGQTIVAGMGELHLEIIVDRLLREFRVDANIGRPQVAYRETIRKRVEGIEGRFVRQTGGRGQYGHAVINAEHQEDPRPRSTSSRTRSSAASSPGSTSPASTRASRRRSIPASSPATRSSTSRSSSSMALTTTSTPPRWRSRSPVPWPSRRPSSGPTRCCWSPSWTSRSSCPRSSWATSMGDLSARRGQIQGMDSRGGGQVIRAMVPLSEMFGYATTVRSKTQGRATFTMQFDHYAEVPKSIAAEIAER